MNKLITFKQSQRHGLFYAFVILLFLLVLVSETPIYLLLGIPLFIGFFRNYQITETGTLRGNGTLAVPTIEILIVKGNKVKIYYRPIASAKRYSRTYYLRDPQAFVNALVAINPSMEVYQQ